MSRQRLAGVGIALTAVLPLLACGSGQAGPSTTDLLATPTPAATGAASTAEPPDCGDPRDSYRPSDAASGKTIVKIKQEGTLVAGVSADTLKMGARNPGNNKIEGFDIDMVRYVADAILGDPDKVTYRVITAQQRVPLLERGEVDIVARAMTMNCARWATIAFSSQYYQAGQKLLVGGDAEVTTLAGLKEAGQKVCVQSGTTTLENVTKAVGEDLVVQAGTATACLVEFQQGTVQAIASDDTILAGLAAQDPYARIAPGRAVTSEPYGLGLPQDRAYVAFVNGVLEDVRRDGRWQESYKKWLEPELNVPATPPAPRYGR